MGTGGHWPVHSTSKTSWWFTRYVSFGNRYLSYINRYPLYIGRGGVVSGHRPGGCACRRQVLGGIGRHWWVLGGTGGYWGVLVGTGRYWWSREKAPQQAETSIQSSVCGFTTTGTTFQCKHFIKLHSNLQQEREKATYVRRGGCFFDMDPDFVPPLS